MTATKRPLALVGAAALLGLALSACGGGASDAPDDASVKEFCDVVKENSREPDLADDDYDAQVEALHDWADALKEVGTPADITAEARKGFEVQVDTLSEIDSDDLEKAGDDDSYLADEFSDDDKDNIGALVKYQIETCSEPEAGVPESDESDR